MICKDEPMIKLLSYLLSKGVVTDKNMFSSLHESAMGLPAISDKPCAGSECGACVQACPTDAIQLKDGKAGISLDRGACINCSVCIDVCPTGTIVSDRDTKTASMTREGLILSAETAAVAANARATANMFSRSVAARVVSTGCSACDSELSAAGNPIFDVERFGVSVVASPRFADVLMVTGPVPKAMHAALRSCYDQLAEPKRVIAVGSCAISGGVHRNSYTEANGVGAVLPVDVFIPGCPPHPWSIIHGILLAMGRV